MTEFKISLDDPRAPDVVQLLADHLAYAREWSLLEDIHVLDAERLAAETVCFFSARNQGRLLAVGALCHLDSTHVEIKSMHTAEEARGQGVGKAMLNQLVTAARDRGYSRVSLETGLGDAFAPARGLYRNSGFEVCQPFGVYKLAEDSVCMTLDLSS